MEKIIDLHAHIFPEGIAYKASSAIGKFYDIPMQEDGTLDTLLVCGEKAGIGHYVVHSVATRPQQAHSINTFIAECVEKHPEKLTGFGTLHPDSEDLEEEFERIVSLGLKGVKIHPDFQEFLIDDPAAMRMYEIIEGRLPLLVHTGDYRYEYSHPKRMAKVLDTFPKLDVIGAHFGGWSVWKTALTYLLDKRIWVDTSSSLYDISPEQGTELVRLWGADRVFFGTDYPMWRHDEEMERFNRLDLTAEERHKILYQNARDFLSIDF